MTSEHINYLPNNSFTEDSSMSEYPRGISAFYVGNSGNSWLGITNGFMLVETYRVATGSAWGSQRITYFGNAATYEVWQRSVGSNTAGKEWGPSIEITTSRNVEKGGGSPEGVVSASPGTLYLRNDSGANTTFYVKESGTGNTGWKAK